MKKAELHCHSNFSKLRIGFLPFLYDSVMTVDEILAAAVKKGIEILAITDHDSVEGSLYAEKIVKQNQIPLLIVPGAEISSGSGHILALGIRKNISPNLSIQDTIERIHDQHGIAIAAHPHGPWGVGDAVYTHQFDSVESWNAAMPEFINRRVKYQGIAASDAHEVPGIGKGITLFSESVTSINDVLQSILANEFSVECNSTNYFYSFTYHLTKGITLFN